MDSIVNQEESSPEASDPPLTASEARLPTRTAVSTPAARTIPSVVYWTFGSGTRTLIRSSGPRVAAIGVEGLVIIATKDAVLVVPRDQSQRVREAAAWYDKELAK